MIGIIGGYGDIGLNAAKLLSTSLKEEIRIGGRNADTLPKDIKEEFKNTQWVQVDINNSESIKAFITGCRIIVNCTGQSGSASFSLAEYAKNIKSSYIDVGANEKLKTLKNISDEVSIIYEAGSIPGLSRIVPGYLAKEFDTVEEMEFYYAALGKFTPTSAKEYLEGLFDTRNKPMMEWKNGKAQPYAINIPVLKTLPFSKEELRLFPYFDKESELIAKGLNLKQGQWYMSTAGNQTIKVLEKARFNYLHNTSDVIQNLCAAAQIDCQSREPYAGFVTQMKGLFNGESTTKTLILKCDSPSQLTALAVASTVLAVSKGLFRSGVQALGESTEVKEYIKLMTELNKALILDIQTSGINELFKEIEGEI